jgi:hypothetical protein
LNVFDHLDADVNTLASARQAAFSALQDVLPADIGAGVATFWRKSPSFIIAKVENSLVLKLIVRRAYNVLLKWTFQDLRRISALLLRTTNAWPWGYWI